MRARPDRSPVLRWRIAEGQSFLWDDYESEVVVFDSVSGSTHVLSPSAAEVLLVLSACDGGLAASEIRSRTVAALGPQASSLDAKHIIELLRHLDRIGLVTCEPFRDAPP